MPAAFAEDEPRENVTLSGSHADVQFLAGRSVTVTADVSDDVFAAGRYVTFDAASIVNAIVAGYAVEQRGGSMSDMIAAGNTVTVSGVIRDDIVAAARSLRITSSGSVGGDARMAAETIDVDGAIGGSLRAAARQVTINGTISGKADLFAERIVVGPEATITGDLIYRGDTAPEVAAGATIGGAIRHIDSTLPQMTRIGMAILGVGIAIAVGWVIASFVLIALVQLVFPRLVADATVRLRTQPWSSLGIGIAGVLIGCILMGLAFASIFAIPLGVALMVSLGGVKLLGLTALGYCIGLMLDRKNGAAEDRPRGARISWSLLGALIVTAVFLIPFVGVVLVVLAVAAAMGAAAVELWGRLRTV
ncbi:polymer-forming cytoskeletal protein [Breoghania sp. L-A4]|uniref:polymer-forming cytoskeletal protein n=1 Tax=Breoghania sp. L-A4 TaxID=2304600 RepID=UPI0013C2CDBD|nr:polymer-forming cytoskeletal protein [Breoghania sp. L-A4]